MEMPEAHQTKDERPIGELVQEASQQTALLVRQELALAQLEMKEKGKRAGIGAGLFGGAGAVAFYGGGVLIAAIVLLLATALEPWIAALIVAAVLFAVAGILALTGKKQVDQAGPAAPEQTIASAKRDIDEVKRRAGS
jgi:MFS family permease